MTGNYRRVLIAVIMLSTTMCNSVSKHNTEVTITESESTAESKPAYSFKGNYDWENNMVMADRKRDGAGRLLPLQSYEETIERGVSFLLHDHLKWFKGSKEILIDENGQRQMPWLYYSNVQHNGEPFPKSIDRFTSYPAFHHSLLIKTFVKLFNSSGDEQILKEAIKLADWNITHSTPSDVAYGSMPYSTLEEKKPGGFRDKSGIMPDKAAIMSLAYIELYKASNEVRFLKAAEAIGQSLAKNQRPNGTWPFRVDPKTKMVIEDYTSSVIYAVMLFENLDELNKNDHYKTYRDRTWEWLLNGPIKTKEFRGFYEDILENTEGRTNYDCLDLIRYLLDKRTESNGYLEIAQELNAWIEDVFMDEIEGFEPAQGIREQLQVNVVMGIHSLNWASMLKDLAEASSDEKMKERAIQTANYITYYLQPDNRIVVGFQYNQWWYSCHIGVILYLLDFLEQEREISKPNIIYIMADDLGYGDLGCYGAIKIKTPNIDKLAANGIRLTDAHSPSAVCTPTRYGVLTGRYSWRGRLKKEVLWSGYERSLIEKDRKTIGNMMQEKGYETAQIGKWHLGWEDKEPVDYSKGTLGRGPKELGFDYSFVTASAHNLFPVVFVENHTIQSQLKPMDYFIYNPELPTPERIFEWHKSHDKGPLEIAIDWKPDQVDKIYTDKAVSFINNHISNKTKDPFYLHLTPEAPHLPNNVPDFMKGKSEAGTRGDHIQLLDWMVGEIISTVDSLGVADNTLIILTSDNGPKQVGIDGQEDGYYFGKFVTDFGHKSAGELRGFKTSIWEGGHRVPFIAKWPNNIAAGQVSDNLICLTDMMASFAAIIGYDMSEGMGEDSFNVLPVILGDDQEIRESIIHQDYGGNLSIRQGDFKLVDDRLYSFSQGITEEVDVAGQYPEKVLELKKLLGKQIENNRTRPDAAQVH